MSQFPLAANLVGQALGDGLVGTPVAVRVLLLAASDAAAREALAARALDAAVGWLSATPRELLAQADPTAGHLSVQVRTIEGATILAAVGPAGDGPGTTSITLVGNHGVASFEPECVGRDSSDEQASADLTPRARELLAAVRRSVAERGPAAVGGGAGPRAKPPAGGRPAATAAPAPAHFKPHAPPYGVLLIRGMHTHQENYAAAFARDPRCRLIGVVDEAGVPPRRRELNEELARSLGVPHLDDLDEALARKDVQVVSICSSPERRAGVIVRAAAAGKHLYLDKPLAATMEEADRIVTAAEKAGVIHHMFSQVHAPVAQRARRLIASAELGELVAVHCDAFFAKGPAGTAKLGQPRRETRRPLAFEAVEAKRELHNVGIYPLVMLRWLLGREVRRVFATTANYFFEEHQRLDMEDFAHLTLELEGGLTATVATGRNGWRSHPSGGLNRTWFIGTKGAACLDAHRPRLEVWNDGDGWPMPRRHPEDPMGFWSSTQAASGVEPKRSWLTEAHDGDARHFIDCLQQGRASDVTALDGAKTLEVILAAYESAATGAAVDLPLPRVG